MKILHGGFAAVLMSFFLINIVKAAAAASQSRPVERQRIKGVK